MNSDICRLCLNDEKVLTYIFQDSRMIMETKLIDCIEYISNVKIRENDEFSQLICDRCNYLVEQSFCFRRKIELSNEILIGNIRIKNAGITIENNDSDDCISNASIDQKSWQVEVLYDEIEDTVTNKEYLGFHEDSDQYDIDRTEQIEPPTINEPSLDSSLVIENYKSIFKINHKTNNFICGICLKECGETVTSILQHLYEHTNNQNWINIVTATTQTYQCNFCQSDFDNISNFFVHIRHHLSIRPYTCQQCLESSAANFEYFTESQLKNHQTKFHLIEESEPKAWFKCSYCSRILNSQTTLKGHELRHIRNANIKCDFCSKKFYFHSELKRHIQLHTGERHYECDICKKRFLSQPEVNRHRKYHTNERRFKCDLCNKNFFESGHLKNHKNMIHFNVKNFECKSCNKKFLTNFKLKRHQKTRSCEMSSDLKRRQDGEIVELTESSNQMNNIQMIDLTSASNFITEINGRSVKIIGIENEDCEIQNYILLDTNSIEYRSG